MSTQGRLFLEISVSEIRVFDDPETWLVVWEDRSHLALQDANGI